MDGHANGYANGRVKSSSIFTSGFVRLFACNLSLVVIYFLLMTTMALHAATLYGVDPALAGLTASVFLVGGIAGRVVCVRLECRFSLRQIGLAFLALQTVAVALYFMEFVGISFLLAVRLLHGVAFGVANTVVPALAIDGLPAGRLGEGTGYFMLSNTLGIGIGPLMSVLIVVGIDYSVLFSICLVLSALSLVLLRTYREPAAAKGRSIASIRARKAPIVDSSTVKFSFFMFLIAFAYSSINAFVESYADELGLGLFAPFVFLVYAAVLLLIRPVTGKLMDRYGEDVILYPSIASMGAGLILVAFARDPLSLLACGVFMATGFGTCMSVGQAAAVKISTSSSTSLTVSTFFILCDAGCGLGPFVLGFLVLGCGYEAMYVACALIAFATTIYYRLIR
ncbi:MFS transporter [Adlercreutzia sp. ZJ473]|uniref:MFS transporter n=1 Tax=Adlercreutzia sp. ZJ473 TaxID=2722822 RepID=UPI001555E693|nr:MFS transporter [Adlercreutzia sp. ZJ473]